ncbi:MAG: DNA-directed RNA polymerase subunit D [Candidatus Heimdallarchaeota archaeon]|nr:DNA-directed RNA polymerase subunit D [Candidatus Heimdallarchaeota archaeon]
MDVRNLPVSNAEANPDILKFIITGTIPAFTNALRRTIMSYVPTIAIDEVIMVENNTAMFDEYIAHRLGLIPLNSDIDDLNVQADCDVCNGAGCNACTVTLTLTQETDLSTTMIIKSSDLIPDDHRVYPMVDEVPIMKMGPDQRLILEAVARFGIGKEHAKWQPTASIGFQYMPTLEIRPGSKFNKKVVEACPRDVLDYDEKSQSINIKDLLSCNLCMECVEVSEKGAIEVKGDHTQIIFLLESNGSLPVENIVTKSSEILVEMTESFIEGFQLGLELAENEPTSMKKVVSFERIPITGKEYEA